MLQVPAVVKPSVVHGLGLFAKDAIKKGTVVWKFNPMFDLVFDLQTVETLPPLQRSWIEYYAYLSKQSGKYVFSGDDYRFINHSPNNNLDSMPQSGEPEWIDVANRDIEVGEELFVNYHSFDDQPPADI